MQMISDAYVAGLFDGEGCITTYGRTRRTRSRGLCVELGLCNKQVIDLISKYYGGCSFKMRLEKSGRVFYRLTWWDRKAAAFIARILPGLIVKREVALLALQFSRMKSDMNRFTTDDGRKGRRLNDKTLLVEREICDKISMINRGIH